MADTTDFERTDRLWTAQPPPVPNDQVSAHEAAAEYLRELDLPELADEVLARGEYGARKYGTKLQPCNGRRFDRDLYEEDLDGLAYGMQGALEGDGDMRAEFRIRAALAERSRRRAARP